MSRENVEVVKRFVDAYNRRDVEAMLEDLGPGIEWHSVILTGLEGETAVYRGHEGFREGLRDLYEALGETTSSTRRSETSATGPSGSAACASVAGRAEPRPSRPHASVVDFKNGKAICIRTYLDPKEALEAAGLEE
jgi:ketosteroid isomerase-like protein